MIIYYSIIYWKRKKKPVIWPHAAIFRRKSLFCHSASALVYLKCFLPGGPLLNDTPPQQMPLCLANLWVGHGVRTFFLVHEFTFSNGDLSADQGSVRMLTPSVQFILRETSWRPCHLRR